LALVARRGRFSRSMVGEGKDDPGNGEHAVCLLFPAMPLCGGEGGGKWGGIAVVPPLSTA